MITFTSRRPAILASFLLVLPASCLAQGCKIGTASAPLHAAVGGGQVCLQKVKAKVCAPAGKVIKSSSVKDLSASPNLDFKSEVKNIDGGCVEATVTVWARNVMGPPIWQYCPEGSYEGRAELFYCR
jgi:hypothetical protein